MNIKALAFFVDVISIHLALAVSFWIRFFPRSYAKEMFIKNAILVPFLITIYIFTLAIKNIYKNRFSSKDELIQKTFKSLSIGLLIGMSFSYIFRERWGTFPTSIFLISFPIIFLTVVAAKLVIYQYLGCILKNVVFIGQSELNNLDGLKDKQIDELVLTTKVADIKQLYLLLQFAEVRQVKLSILPELYDEILVKKINGTDKHQIIIPAYFRITSEESLIRASDIVISYILLFFALPIMVLIALIIKIYSPGSVFYKQRRVGLNGKEFMLYKFRSMKVDAGQFSRPEHIAIEDDSRVTKLGRFLRKARLDELPQLFNILRGNMSLVGPRPEAVYRVKEHRALQGIRLSVRPGLTGLAQIEGHYHTAPAHKLKYDYLYIKNRSVLLNLNILCRTVLMILFKPGS